MIWALVTALPGLAGRLFGVLENRANAELQGFLAGSRADAETRKAYWASHVENNRLKLAAQGWWGAKAIMLIAGLPMALHMGAVALDTLIPPFGSWGIPKLPPPYDGYERDIVLSFFIIAPIMPVASAAAQWLGRRR